MHDTPTTVVLALGANLGDRLATLRAAVERCSAALIRDVRCSRVYETEPVGYVDQPAFLNMIVVGETMLGAHDLAQACSAIEIDLGRQARAKWHEREIDIDIVLYGREVIGSPTLEIPHPRMHERRFVLQPCAEVVPEMVHPILDTTINALLHDCADTAAVRPFAMMSCTNVASAE
jgi:2-amino-4-hydroxy-6-hydroxymethyldihydropteridine diphosphokinase